MAPPVVTIELKDDKEVLKAAYRSCHDAVEKRRIQAVWQFAEGKTREEVRELTAFSNSVLIKVIHRYNEAGLAGLKDKRRQNKGVAPLLNEVEREQLYQALLEPPEAGGLWSGPKVAAWMSKTLNKEVHPQRGWDYLKKLGFSLQRPRPSHRKADPEAQAAFKKEAVRAL